MSGAAKIVKYVAVGLGALVLLAVFGLGTRFYVFAPKERPAPNVKAPTDAASVARGKYLVLHVTGCLGCHSPVHEDLPGDVPVESHLGAGRNLSATLDTLPGQIRPENLTPDKEYGLGNWTDGEILRAMREGISKDGRVLFPLMPYQTYANVLSDADALDIIAYLRTLPPQHTSPGPTVVDFPVSMFIRAVPQPLKNSPPPEPPATDLLARGRWLLTAGSCGDCHTTRDAHMKKIAGDFLAGGMAFPVPGKGTVYARNITGDPKTGIGKLSDEQVLRAITKGIGPKGHILYGMPWSDFSGLTDVDQKALLTALRQVPPVHHPVPSDTIKF